VHVCACDNVKGALARRPSIGGGGMGWLFFMASVLSCRDGIARAVAGIGN
jgi:hypothetical protein